MSREMVPRHRVAAVVQAWIDKWLLERPMNVHHGQQNENVWFMGPIGYLETHSGVPQRSIRRILSGPSQSDKRGSGEFVTLHSADRLLIAMGLEYLWALPPEQGGLSDVYYQEAA